MNNLTKIEQINLLAFIRTMLNKDIGEDVKEEICRIYYKLKKEFKNNG